MINTLSVEHISRQSTSLRKIFSEVSFLSGGDFQSCAGQRKRSSFTDMQILDEPWSFQTQPYDDTQVYINGRENGRKLQKGTQKRVNEFFTNLPPKT